MIKKYNNRSLAWGIPGLVLQIVGQSIGQLQIAAIGSFLLVIGLTYYAMGKGRNPAWGLMAFLSIIGVIVLAYLDDLGRDSLE